MKAKIKNLIIFVVIGALMLGAYFFFIKKAPEEPNLATSESSPTTTATTGGVSSGTLDTQLSKDFLSVLLSIKSISLDDSIFADVAFQSLKDSTIVLLPDGSEGRPNPFAPIGTDINIVPDSFISDLGASNAEDGLFTDLDVSIETNTPLSLTSPTTTAVNKIPTTRKP